METVTIDGIEYPVRYQHHRVTDAKGVIQTKGGRTTAYIVDKVNNRQIAFAEAFCSVKDNYRRPMGRKIAYGRLIKKIVMAQRMA